VCVLSFTYFIHLLLFWLLSFAFVSFVLSPFPCAPRSLSLSCIDFFPCAPRSLPLQLRGSTRRRRRRRTVDASFATGATAAAELGGGGGGGGELEELE
jgi:hypothetical protein